MSHSAPHDYRGDFEIHITVSAADEASRDCLRDWCDARGFKCVWIVLARGEFADQPMATWRHRRTTLPAVVEEANSHAGRLNALGIAVTRVKVEAAPHNDGIPATDADATAHAPGNYFEHHVKLLRAKDSPKDVLLEVCAEFGAHLSRNAFRDAPEGKEERFVTLRAYGVGSAASDAQFRRLLAALAQCGEEVIESESEYCVYDSAQKLDAGWLELTPRAS